MNTLTPNRVQPGWLKRWTIQSLELYRRAPLVPVGYTIIWAWVTVFESQFKFVFMLMFMALAVTLYYIFLRAMDEGAKGLLATFYSYFTNSWRDIYGLMRVAGLFSLLMFFMAIGIHWASSFMPAIPIHTGHSYLIFPDWSTLEKVFFMGGVVTLIMLCIFGEWMLSVYLTLLVGYNFHVNRGLMYEAIRLNYRNLPVVFVFSMGSTVLLLMLLSMSTNPAVGWIIGAVLMMGFTWLSTWGYLASREIFEGRGKNCEVTVAQSESVLSVGTS